MGRVLVVEADAELLALAREALEREGWTVDHAGTATEAILRARLERPDVVVADADLSEAVGLHERLRTAIPPPPLPVGLFNQAGEVGDEAVAAATSASCGLGTRPVGPSERRRAFMRNLAHELSTPLTPIAGYLRILKSEKLGSLSARQRLIVDAMIQSTRKLTGIVENLSDFATLAPGDPRLHEAPLDPDRLAEEVVEEQLGAIRDGRLHVEVKPSGFGPILADEKKLHQALSNLVSNAVKFSPHGGEVLVEVSQDPGRLRISIYDQGPGIVAAESESIFEPLQTARRSSEKAGPPGSGLGLPVARRIAQAHGGEVFVESPPREQPRGTRAFGGCRFVLEIPARPADRAIASEGAGASAH